MVPLEHSALVLMDPVCNTSAMESTVPTAATTMNAFNPKDSASRFPLEVAHRSRTASRPVLPPPQPPQALFLPLQCPPRHTTATPQTTPALRFPSATEHQSTCVTSAAIPLSPLLPPHRLLQLLPPPLLPPMHATRPHGPANAPPLDMVPPRKSVSKPAVPLPALTHSLEHGTASRSTTSTPQGSTSSRSTTRLSL
jgi:hypothetical protein